MSSLRDKLIAQAEEKVGKIPKRYVPSSLNITDLRSQLSSIVEQKDRPKVKSVKPRKSKWTAMAQKYFDGKTGVPDMASHLAPGNSERQKQLVTGFKRIIKKGEAAYYSSGSRPGVSATQWGIARLYAVLFGSKPARRIDNDIVDEFNIPLLTGSAK